eukprot:Nk52_evm5s136 gene=Nk52_evmTU5s136
MMFVSLVSSLIASVCSVVNGEDMDAPTGQPQPGFVVWWGQAKVYLISILAALLVSGLVRKYMATEQRGEKQKEIRQKEKKKDQEEVPGEGDSCSSKQVEKSAKCTSSSSRQQNGDNGCCGGGSCGSKKQKKIINSARIKFDKEKDTIYIFAGSQTGKASSLAKDLETIARGKNYQTQFFDLKSFEVDDLSDMKSSGVCVFVASTYTGGNPCENASWFFSNLEDQVNDFRVQKTSFRGLNYCVFGVGNSLYAENYNKAGRNLDKWLTGLGAYRAMPLGLGDENVSESVNGGLEEDFASWIPNFFALVEGKDVVVNESEGSDGCCGSGKSDANTADASAAFDDSSSDDDDNEDDDEDGQDVYEEESSGLVDVEDLGSMMQKMKKAKANRAEEEKKPRDMINPALRKALTKQGYKLIGSHSGVKLCRWTKSMLRGRGGCYKHTFYGIESHRCMETTPSLACANKCVFCWRHHTNPVGTEWRWNMDPPEDIINGAMENHYKMIKTMKGVPGVIPERYEEGLNIRHCALSLVGEPIMYPEISTFVKMLHERGISSFLVTNAQFPDAIANLEPVTQLYVSIDASTKDSLQKIDRPLFKDFWERFLFSLDELSRKGQRTVYRLTLVKAWNVDEMKAYGELIRRGNPDFIEIKGVTFCGDSKASSLTMDNVPWHDEVIAFVQQLVDQLDGYEICSEHEHSNSFTEEECVSGTSQVKSSVGRGIRKKILEQYPMLEEVIDDLMPKKSPIILVKCHDHINIVAVGGEMLFFNERDGPYYPLLKILHKYPNILPHQQVDRGAIQFVLSGANIMCPGLTSPGAKLTEDLPEGTIVAVMCEGKKHAIAVGLMKMSSEVIKTKNKGHGIDNIHYLNDGLWRAEIQL